MGYVTGTDVPKGSGERADIFLDSLASAADPDSLVVHVGEKAFIIMNLFPYNTGHMMVVPKRRVATLEELEPPERAELMELVNAATEVGNIVLNCDGFNIGLNIGSVAGAGIADHLHVHVVPRWLGDANFMPITADTMVLPELLPATTARIKGEFVARNAAQDDAGAHATAGAVVYVPNENRFVLRQAKDGTVVLPKGHIERGESAAGAAIREVHEETGFRATVTQWGGTERFEHNGKKFHVTYFVAIGDRTRDAVSHLGVDTLLVDPGSLEERLTFAGSQRIARRALDVLELAPQRRER